MNTEKEEEKNAVIIMKKTEFNNIKNEKRAAIHLKNCSLSCTNEFKFIEVKTENCEWVAIYINNPIDLINSVTLNGLYFEKCSTTVEGALYSTSFLNTVSININASSQKIQQHQMKMDVQSLCLWWNESCFYAHSEKKSLGPDTFVILINNFEQDKNTG